MKKLLNNSFKTLYETNALLDNQPHKLQIIFVSLIRFLLFTKMKRYNMTLMFVLTHRIKTKYKLKGKNKNNILLGFKIV